MKKQLSAQVISVFYLIAVLLAGELGVVDASKTVGDDRRYARGTACLKDYSVKLSTVLVK